ncbi:hypothetical protein NE237_006677 [Protea cynaroides]|uniref:Uncharacterized protein n=1 Tax=Protea cynaroides TaxID=273540 RepID=A0A9Q0KMQ9_9MAGN|nr:hypothetical protein NE237_006677 [Protea cynaroides]
MCLSILSRDASILRSVGTRRARELPFSRYFFTRRNVLVDNQETILSFLLLRSGNYSTVVSSELMDMESLATTSINFPAKNFGGASVYCRSSRFSSLFPCLIENWGNLRRKKQRKERRQQHREGGVEKVQLGLPAEKTEADRMILIMGLIKQWDLLSQCQMESRMVGNTVAKNSGTAEPCNV